MPILQNTLDEIRRGMARLAMLREQIKAIEQTRAERLEQAPETTVFLSYFKHPPDRRQLGKVIYPLRKS
jgi:hypothetical protein